MSARRVDVASFDVKGETALAWYFVMAHWPSRATQPTLQIESSPMKVLLDETPEAFHDLHETLAYAGTRSGLTAKSAKALAQELEKRSQKRPSPLAAVKLG
jgi:hypothetical protein